MGLFNDIVSKVSSFATSLFGSSAKAADTAQPAAGAAAPSIAQVDVDAVLKELAAKAGQPLNYKESIVDLLKLLGLDSSLQARQSLADDLHYTGDKNDTATMNVWLIKQVYTELANNGGKIPAGWGH
ncbi:DUF3597 domain-containing protein [Parasaccharibacter sp. TMW2.1882]|uniref:DUF3597 domain-containing protein n=2 Tax=Acetobacteraceae TaxID=433 RepID=A0ABX4ZPP0_9PROT|nr:MULTISPECIES: DUF3597 domain-containing protein [Acetobacteraceae]MCL1563421.1 DUF3597 domain-containing protein [Parasaccharibacter sp. TMW 2.1886]MCQ0041781.1 DUF3597 domain-containing protein [Bombella sp.]MUG80260.1 DUF3597 family protein [Bombella sp. ESL0380]MUH03611.1 DUF3597 family protein [Bombella sp. ESL0387]QGT74346.1 DUF3597 family protein [Bombella sp. ESL0368]